ncbi:MAG: YkoP family protein [Chloroflexota bacterium]
MPAGSAFDFNLTIWLFRHLAAGTHAGRPRGILRIWPVWEAIEHSRRPLFPIPEARYGVFKICLTSHRGEAVVLRDGSTINRGDPVAEVHADNRALLALMPAEGRWPLQGVLGSDLRALAVWVGSEGAPPVKALHGVTLVSAGAARLGFERRERPRRFWSGLERFYMSGLLAVYTPEGIERVARGHTREMHAQEIWMSQAELLRRYGTA